MSDQTPQSTFDERLTEALTVFKAHAYTARDSGEMDKAYQEAKAAITSLVLEDRFEYFERGHNAQKGEYELVREQILNDINTLDVQQRSIITKEKV